MLSYPEYGIEIELSGEKDTTKDAVRFIVDGNRFDLSNDLRHQPRGIKSVTATLGIKKSGKTDFAAVLLPQAAPAAAVFTSSRCPSVTIIRGREVLKSGKLRGLIVNSGNANVFTPTGEKDLNEVVRVAAEEFGCSADDLLMCSTGIIGVPLPVEKFTSGIPGLSARLSENALETAAEAILTTDLGPKTVSFKHRDWVLCGMAKGAGMIEPNLATMLVYFFTDVKMSSKLLQAHLESAVAGSFNALSIDSDMSTSDAVALFSTADVPLREEDQSIFSAALRAMSIKLGRDIVSQGEGVSKIIECLVETDISADFSKKVAKLIINSPLVKTAICGGDPNWGRIVAAIGKVEGEEPFVPEAIRIWLVGELVFDRGGSVHFDLEKMRAAMKSSSCISIRVQIGEARFSARVWGSDLTEAYVRFNSDYTS